MLCSSLCSQVNDAALTEAGDLLVTASADGSVRLWDAAFTSAPAAQWPAAITPLAAFQPYAGLGVARVLLAGAGGDARLLITLQENSSGDSCEGRLKLWYLGGGTGPVLQQSLVLESGTNSSSSSSSSNSSSEQQQQQAFTVAMSPSRDFLCVADSRAGLLHALHLRWRKGAGRSGARFDFLRPYALNHPVVSFVVLDSAAEEDTNSSFYDSRDEAAAAAAAAGGGGSSSSKRSEMSVYAVQTKPVQIYKLPVAEAYPAGTVSSDVSDDEAESEADVAAVGTEQQQQLLASDEGTDSEESYASSAASAEEQSEELNGDTTAATGTSSTTAGMGSGQEGAERAQQQLQSGGDVSRGASPLSTAAAAVAAAPQQQQQQQQQGLVTPGSLRSGSFSNGSPLLAAAASASANGVQGAAASSGGEGAQQRQQAVGVNTTEDRQQSPAQRYAYYYHTLYHSTLTMFVTIVARLCSVRGCELLLPAIVAASRYTRKFVPQTS
jgi:hypothetical protein